MPDRWQRFAFYLKGYDDPVEVQTTARDWARVTIDPAEGLEAMALTFQVIWFALQREGYDVPATDFDAFCDLLEGPPEAISGAAPALDPTAAARSGEPR